MKIIINPNMGLLALGVLQPASAAEVRGFLKIIFREGGSLPPLEDFRKFLHEQEAAKRVIRVSRKGTPYYSLTLLGSLYLSPDMRKRRDKFRAYLLRDSHSGRYIVSRGSDVELAGVAPALDTSTSVKGSAANKVGRRFDSGQPYWPRISGQFAERTGHIRRPRDTFPSLLSFHTREQAELACDRPLVFDYVGLGTCLGLSPQLIWNIAQQPDKHYRSFEIPKKAGGTRLIESPRVFLKVIQWFLADYILSALPVHHTVHSYSFKKSIASNASNHTGRRFVGNSDIEDFFGSVTSEMITKHLREFGFSPPEAVAISKLCTNFGSLPQGAPTSPIISNSILFSVDELMDRFCLSKGMSYTRYADDVTISGDSHSSVSNALKFFEHCLAQFRLQLNSEKTRIASLVGQQKVTGVVVNEFAAPSRSFRRTARAMFHNASKNPDAGIRQLDVLGGVLGFLKIFPHLRETEEIQKYQNILSLLKQTRRELSKAGQADLFSNS